jgi:hypothetical protein
MKKILSIIIAIFVFTLLSGQEREIKSTYHLPTSPVTYPVQTHYLVNESRYPMYLPVLDDYVLLKADLHLHTIFSDGSIWPTTRVEEAFREGLDVIAITDHLEFHFINRDKVISDDLNMEYNIAKELAKELGIMLIPGAEITREVPAGHYNVLFLEDANKLKPFINPENPRDTLTLIETLKAARELGCFITWNHPAYRNPRRRAEWGSIHQEIYSLGLMNGIEIINSNSYIPLVHNWAMDKGITMLSNSDSHTSVRFREGQHRPITIILAKERTPESVKEALFSGRTVGYSRNYLYGKEEYVTPIFSNSIKSRLLSWTEKLVVIELRNISGIPYELLFEESDNLVPAPTNIEIVIYPNETIALKFIPKNSFKGDYIIKTTVNNIHPEAQKPLVTYIR